MAQDGPTAGDTTEVIQVKTVIINDWDGGYKSPNMPLYIGVGEYKILSLTVTPEDADLSTIHLGMSMEEGDQENSPLAFWGMEIGAFWPATRTLRIYNDDYSQELASTQITAYATSGEIGNDSTTTWTIETNEETGETQLVISQDPTSGDFGVLADRAEGDTYPWDEFAQNITKLEVDGNFSYIGSGVFDQLYNLQNIQFTGDNIESIHYQAFPIDIHPWRFAFGNPQNGPLVPPQVNFGDMDPKDAIQEWMHMFSEETVLYVPDQTFTYQGREVRAVDLYRGDKIWGDIFRYIDDHTVGVAEVTDSSLILSWMPQEGATAYILRIQKAGCEECDTTIYIYADGYRGLIEDWYNDYPAPIVRAPRSDDGGGGMTITITIGGGGYHTQEVTAEVTGMEPQASYDYSRQVETYGGVSEDLSKSGTIQTKPVEPTGIEEIWVSGEKRVYDLLGRPVSTSVEDLPAGIYILDNGKERATIMIGK